MKLSRIRIDQFKQFRRPLEIKDLDPGLNLFTGPNEAGKSTIVTAIRAAFFERHRSGSVDDLRPWGDSSASPTVELEFAIGDRTYRLTKSFLGKKRCELQAGPRRLDGAEAEDHLAELLGFRYAGRGSSAAEHWGIPGLLWIQQGAAHDIKESVAHATDHLRNALNESLGEVASSGGDEVLMKVEAARNELLTPATGSPRGPYAEALRQAASLAKDLKVLDAAIAAYRQKVDTLAALRREHAADANEKPWLTFRAEQLAAADKLAAIKRIEETLAAEELRATRTDDRIKLLHSQLETFASQERAAETRRAALESARQAQSTTTAEVEHWASQRKAAAEVHEAMRETLRRARLEDTRLHLMRQSEDIKLAQDGIAAALAKAEAEQAALLALQRRTAASEVKPQDLKVLREQQQQIRELQIRQTAAATRLRFALNPGYSIQADSEPLAGTGERLLLDATTLMLPGLGKLEIAPGGTDLAELGRKATNLADRQAALLQRLGLASLDAVEARHQTHSQWLTEIKTATATLKALAPQGVEALRTELAAHHARAGEIEQALNKLPPEAAGADRPPSITDAETAEEAASKSLAQFNDRLHAAQLAASTTRATFEAATQELASALAILGAADRPERVAAANRDLVEALAERATLTARIETLSKQVAEARPDILAQDVERLRKSANQLEQRFNERRDTLLRLEAELQATGAEGPEERRAELTRDLVQAERRTDELHRRAKALDHLLILLRDKRRALTRRLQTPLQKHLNRYLQLLFPTASLEIDENLTPGPLTRSGANGAESGEFDTLSFGAREQMGVISRLAYADLLQEAGRPTLIILDDALVHTDEARLAQMKRVLFDAATRHQILLFTCHPEKWRDLGVGARSLEAIRASA